MTTDHAHRCVSRDSRAGSRPALLPEAKHSAAPPSAFDPAALNQFLFYIFNVVPKLDGFSDQAAPPELRSLTVGVTQTVKLL